MHEEVKPMGKRMGKMLDIDGTRATVIRKYPTAGIVRIQAYAGMAIHINDHVKTDDKTQAVIESDIGGRIGIGPETEIVVLTLRAAEAVGNPIYSKAVKVWAKRNKHVSQLQIQTNGGVIGIEG